MATENNRELFYPGIEGSSDEYVERQRVPGWGRFITKLLRGGEVEVAAASRWIFHLRAAAAAAAANAKII